MLIGVWLITTTDLGFDISSRLDSLFHQKSSWWYFKKKDPSFASEILLSTNGSVSKSLIFLAKISNKRGLADDIRLIFSKKNEGESKTPVFLLKLIEVFIREIPQNLRERGTTSHPYYSHSTPIIPWYGKLMGTGVLLVGVSQMPKFNSGHPGDGLMPWVSISMVSWHRQTPTPDFAKQPQRNPVDDREHNHRYANFFQRMCGRV